MLFFTNTYYFYFNYNLKIQLKNLFKKVVKQFNFSFKKKQRIYLKTFIIYFYNISK